MTQVVKIISALEGDLPNISYPYKGLSFTGIGSSVSDQGILIQDQYKAVIPYLSIPISRQNTFQKFSDLSETWKEESKFSSSIIEIAMNPAYQQIIGMGEIALPLIFHDLEKEPNHWFWALKAITGTDPVKSEDRGNIKKMTEAWLSWGRNNAYL